MTLPTPTPGILDQIREHLGSVSMHATVLMQNTVEDSDDWYQASKALEHSEAAGAKIEALLAESRLIETGALSSYLGTNVERVLVVPLARHNPNQATT